MMNRFAVVAKSWRRHRSRADLDTLMPVAGHYLHAIGGIILVLGGLYMLAPVLVIMLCVMMASHLRNDT